jgi:hypothetical protein
MTDEEVAREMAHIFGPHSASGKAIAELDRRRANGEKVGIVTGPNKTWLVFNTKLVQKPKETE